MFFYMIYTNYNQKQLAKINKPVISWNKFKKQAFKEGKIVFQEK